DNGEKTSVTAASSATITDAFLAEGAEITVDIDQIGTNTAARGLKVYILGEELPREQRLRLRGKSNMLRIGVPPTLLPQIISVPPALADSPADCYQGKDPDRVIQACSEVIAEGNPVWKRATRAIAYSTALLPTAIRR